MKAIVIGMRPRGRDPGAHPGRQAGRSPWWTAGGNLSRLGPDWREPLVLGHGMDAKVLEEAGVEDADVLIAATDGDNTNLVISQVATERKHEVVHVRLLDPARAEAYATGPPHRLARERRSRARGWALESGGDLMFAIVVGGGKVGANVARRLRGAAGGRHRRAGTVAVHLEAEFGHA